MYILCTLVALLILIQCEYETRSLIRTVCPYLLSKLPQKWQGEIEQFRYSLDLLVVGRCTAAHPSGTLVDQRSGQRSTNC